MKNARASARFLQSLPTTMSLAINNLLSVGKNELLIKFHLDAQAQQFAGF